MNPPNEKRNRKLVEFRDSDPDTWSFGELGRFFHIKSPTAHEIYHREKAKVKLRAKGKR